MVKKVFYIGLTLALVSCASGLKEQMNDYRKNLELKQFEKAQDVLSKSKLKEDKKSRLLWLLENGSINLIQKNYDEAIKNFQAATELIDDLYTTKISNKLASFVINDAQDVYYGSAHERSLSYYYLARAHYERYLFKKDRNDLFAARAAILAWDTYFQAVNRSDIKTLYRSDILLKVFGGQIHEQIQTAQDNQIALQLYKDALKMSERIGGIFSYFNEKSSEFIKASEEKLMKDSEISRKYFSSTEGYKDFVDFLHFKILSLTYQVRRYDFDKLARELKASEAVIKNAKKDHNVKIIFEENLIAKKVGEKFSFGLKGAMGKVDDPKTRSAILAQGAPVIAAFAMNVLKLYPSRSAGPGGFIFAHQVTTLAVTEAAIEFELPVIEKKESLKRLGLYVMDDKGKVITVRPLVLISETSDLARLVLEENVVSQYAATGTRVAVKHLAAIVAAMGIYRQFKDNELLASTMAIGSYIASSKAIAWMEEADTRQWLSLPEGIRVQEFNLKPGKYKLGLGVAMNEKWPDTPSKTLGEIEVSKNKELFTFRL